MTTFDGAIIVDFADKVMVPTYAALARGTEALASASRSLASAPTPDNLRRAQEAWKRARAPWEQCEGFLFGPVKAYGFDPAMDSWPVNRTDLDMVLSGGDALTPAFVDSLQETQKGFHTIEYMLFGEDASREARDLDARKLAYTVAIAEQLDRVADSILASWTKGYEGAPAYRDLFAGAGRPGNTAYPTVASAAQEIVNGLMVITDEVANGKIADPYDARDKELIESQFSLLSLQDFRDNIVGVENMYLGRVELAGTRGKGISSYVARVAPAVDAKVKARIAASLAALDAIPKPFSMAIVNADARPRVARAQEAIRELFDTLEAEVLPLVQR